MKRLRGDGILHDVSPDGDADAIDRDGTTQLGLCHHRVCVSHMAACICHTLSLTTMHKPPQPNY